MAHIKSRYVEAEMESRGSDDEIFKRDEIAFSRLLALNTAGKLSYLQRQRVHDKHLENFGRKDTPPGAMIFAASPMDSMCEFDGSYRRNTRVSVAPISLKSPQDSRRRFTPAFLFNEKACIEDQSQQISPTPIDRLACGYG